MGSRHHGDLACNVPSSKNTEIKNGREHKVRSNKGRKGSPSLKIWHYNCQGLVGETRLYELEKALYRKDQLGCDRNFKDKEGGRKTV